MSTEILDTDEHRKNRIQQSGVGIQKKRFEYKEEQGEINFSPPEALSQLVFEIATLAAVARND